MPPDTFTPRELDVMSILWDMGSATVADVQERIGDPLAYTTVLSVLRTLKEKGYVRHEAEGRAYRYYALVDWRAAGPTKDKPVLSAEHGSNRLVDIDAGSTFSTLGFVCTSPPLIKRVASAIP